MGTLQSDTAQSCNPRYDFSHRLLAMITLTWLALVLVAQPAAAATAGSGSATGIAASAQFAPLVGVTAQASAGPLPSVAGNAPPDYALPASAASASLAVGALGTIASTGVLQVNSTATLASEVSQSSASVDNLDVGVAGLVGLTAAVVQSTASVACVQGVVTPAGGTTLTGAGLTLLGLPVSISATPAPNTTISVAGVQVVLNEQVTSGNSVTVTAVHVTITNAILAALGMLNADIAVARSSASLTSTCPPATAPDLALSISQPVPDLVAGQTSVITVTLSNVGTAAAPGPQSVSVTLPSGVSAPSTFANGGWSCSNAGGTVACTSPGAVAAAGSTSFTIEITPAAALVGTKPTVTASTPAAAGETNVANNSASMTTNVAVAAAPPTPAPDLALSIAQPSPTYMAGSPSVVTVTVSNAGTAPAPGPRSVSVSLPAGLTAPGAFASQGYACTAASNTVTCQASGALAAGASAPFDVSVTPSASTVGTRPSLSANAPAAQGETNLANNTATMTADVAVAAAPPTPVPDLYLVIAQPSPAFVAGQASTVAVTLGNSGAAAAPGPQAITLALPAGLSAPAAFSDGAWSCGTSGSTVSCTSAASLPVQAMASLNVVVTPAASTVGTTPTLTASTPAAPGETNLANNQASMTAAVAVSGGGGGGTPLAPDLALSIAQPTPALVVGQASRISLTLSNVGNAAASGPQSVNVALPAGMPASSATAAGWSCAGTTSVTCTSAVALATGGSASLALDVVPDASLQGTTPTVTASTPAAAGETNLANNQASMTAAVAVGAGGGGGSQPPTSDGKPDLAVTVGAPTPPLVVGEISQVPVTVANVGTADATGPIRVNVQLPAQTLSPPGVTSGDWACSIASHLAACVAAISLPPGGSSSFLVPVTPEFSSGGQEVIVTVEAPAAPGETNLANNSATMKASVLGPGADENYQDLWWNPAESGWGVGLFHQGDTIVAAIYDYGTGGAPTWQFVANAQRTNATTFAGALYTLTGTPYSTLPFNASQTQHQEVGSAQLTFTDPYNATFVMTINGTTYTKSITRQTFASLATIAGQYAMGTKTVLSSCTDASRNGTTLGTGTASITVSGNAFTIVRAPAGTGPTCTTTGTAAQHGSILVALDLATSCSDGSKGVGMSLMRILNGTLTERVWQTQSEGAGCNAVSTSAGVR